MEGSIYPKCCKTKTYVQQFSFRPLIDISVQQFSFRPLIDISVQQFSFRPLIDIYVQQFSFRPLIDIYMFKVCLRDLSVDWYAKKYEMKKVRSFILPNRLRFNINETRSAYIYIMY